MLKNKNQYTKQKAPNMKVSVLHMKIRPTLQDNLIAAKTAVLKAAKQKPALIALPEYFTVPNCMADFTNAQKISQETSKKTLQFLEEVSRTIGEIYLLGGTVLEEDESKYYNTSTLWKNGKMLAKYKKISPIKAEIEAGVSKGFEPVVVDTDLGKIGMIVCADTFNPDVVTKVAMMGAEIISLPVAAMGTHPTVQGSPLNGWNCEKLRFLHLKSRQRLLQHEGRTKRNYRPMGRAWRSHRFTGRLDFKRGIRYASVKRLPSATQQSLTLEPPTVLATNFFC